MVNQVNALRKSRRHKEGARNRFIIIIILIQIAVGTNKVFERNVNHIKQPRMSKVVEPMAVRQTVYPCSMLFAALVPVSYNEQQIILTRVSLACVIVYSITK